MAFNELTQLQSLLQCVRRCLNWKKGSGAVHLGTEVAEARRTDARGGGSKSREEEAAAERRRELLKVESRASRAGSLEEAEIRSASRSGCRVAKTPPRGSRKLRIASGAPRQPPTRSPTRSYRVALAARLHARVKRRFSVISARRGRRRVYSRWAARVALKSGARRGSTGPRARMDSQIHSRAGDCAQIGSLRASRTAKLRPRDYGRRRDRPSRLPCPFYLHGDALLCLWVSADFVACIVLRG